ncbi:MAG TPA: endonuclease, partial [Candidatus Avibacteroides excrementipullorum]|nr:endonuclease [Candidatus Avibacteroides excrementipullorum]
IALAADQYIKMNEIDMPVRFDIISITGTGNDVHLEHIEDAFTAPLM